MVDRLVGFRRWQFVLNLLSSIVVIAVIVIVAWRFDDFTEGISTLTWVEFFGLVGLTLCSLFLRTAVWSVSVRHAHVRVKEHTLHSANGLAYIVSLFNQYLALGLKVWMLDRLNHKRDWELRRTFTADLSAIWFEVAATVILMIICAGLLGFSLWFLAIVAVLILILSHRILHRLQREYVDSPLIQGTRILFSKGAFLVIPLVILNTVAQVSRYWIALNAVGLESSLLLAIAFFLLSSIFNLIPVGVGPSPALSALVIFQGQAGLAVSAGLVLAAGLAVSAVTYFVIAISISAYQERHRFRGFFRDIEHASLEPPEERNKPPGAEFSDNEYSED